MNGYAKHCLSRKYTDEMAFTAASHATRSASVQLWRVHKEQLEGLHFEACRSETSTTLRKVWTSEYEDVEASSS